jgi:hypothetical protein
VANPSPEHQQAVKRILRYVKGTADQGLTLGGTKVMRGYSDADWGSSDECRRSISGYAFLYGRGAVSWSSKRQQTVALSTTEAEYMAVTHATKEAVWLSRLLHEIDGKDHTPMLLNVDNQSCIALAKNPVHHARTKHIDVQHHFIREMVETGAVRVEYCPTKEMTADVLTKPVPKEKHNWCTSQLGVARVVG